MNPFKTIWTRLRSLGQATAMKQDIDEELRFHIEQSTAENIGDGMSPEEAAREARKQFGNLQSVREECRETRGAGFGEAMIQDVRFGARMLRKNFGFTTVAVLTLALGIGANTAIFSVVNAVLLRPLPYPESERLVDVNGPLSIPNFGDWKEQQTVFEELVLYKAADFNVVGGQGAPLAVMGVALSADAFPALRITPELGRFFGGEEDKVGGPPVVVLGHTFWQTRFGSDPSVLNKTVFLNGTGFTVLGVMPAIFELVDKAALFVPIEPSIRDNDRNSRKNQSGYQAFARLKPGMSKERAQLEMNAISQRLEISYPEINKGSRISLKPLLDSRVGNFRATLWILLGAVLLVLLIACANVANLLLVRATGRRKEIAVRSAMGASHGRILRQMLTESLLLAAFGGVLGLLLARVSMVLIIALAQDNLPRAGEIGIDGSVLLFSMVVALLTGILFGFAPAWQASRVNLSRTLKDGGKGSSAGRTPFLNGLMVGQVALSLVLLFGAGLLLRSFYHLSQVNGGFNHERVLSFRLDLPDDKYRTPGVIDRFAEEMLSRVRALPGVQAVSLATELPIGGRSWVTDLLVEGRPEPEHRPLMELNLVGSDYFHVMGIQVIRGRAFNDSDSRPPARGTDAELAIWLGMKSIIIDEEFSRRVFSNEDPIGKQIRIPWGADRSQDPVVTIVGVVGRVKQEKLREENAKVLPVGYLPFRERPNRHIAVVAKTIRPPENLVRATRDQIAAMDPGLPIYHVTTLAEMRDANIAPDRLNMTLLGSAALIALLLAIIGIYGVVAFSVAQRQREIGIRMALGARRRDVLNLILRQGMWLVSIGTLLGLIGAIGFGRVLANLLFQVDATDLPTLTIVPLILFGAAGLACALPARRATKVDPMVALRHE